MGVCILDFWFKRHRKQQENGYICNYAIYNVLAAHLLPHRRLRGERERVTLL